MSLKLLGSLGVLSAAAYFSISSVRVLRTRAKRLSAFGRLCTEMSESIAICAYELSTLLRRFSDARFAPYGEMLAEIADRIKKGEALGIAWNICFVSADDDPLLRELSDDLLSALQSERRVLASSRLADLGERAKTAEAALDEYIRGDGQMYQKLIMIVGALVILLFI